MRRIAWSHASLRDFRNIISYIAERNPIAAESVSRRLLETVDALGRIPAGRPGRMSGTYEKVVAGWPYIVAYKLGTDLDGSETVYLLRIIHGARDWTRDRWPEEETP
jgi:toxin ParE1/3/4